MASPQKENGYTAIANELMDALCRTRIAGEERQILDCILRKTYGWNKCEDAISISQFSLMTGIKDTHVIRAINGLLSKKVISVTENGNHKVKVYKFVKDYHLWQPLPKKVTFPKKVTGVPQNGNSEFPKMGDTKENTKTTTKTNNTPSADFLAFWNYYPKKSGKKLTEEYFNKMKNRPDINVLLTALNEQIKWREEANGDFRPQWKDPIRWLKGNCWEDEITFTEEPKQAWEK